MSNVVCTVLLRAVYFSATWGDAIYASVPQSCVEILTEFDLLMAYICSNSVCNEVSTCILIKQRKLNQRSLLRLAECSVFKLGSHPIKLLCNYRKQIVEHDYFTLYLFMDAIFFCCELNVVPCISLLIFSTKKL